MERNIKTVRDARVNIKPIVCNLIHEYFFEGPCRFGLTEESLSTEFDEMVSANKEIKMMKDLRENIPDSIANIMDPIVLNRHEDFRILEEWIQEFKESADQVDLYWISGGGYEAVIDFYTAFDIKTPLAIMKPCCTNFAVTAYFRARGITTYGWINYEEAITAIKALRAKKVLSETKVLLAPRANSNLSMTVPENFISFEDATRKLGTRFRYVNVHEVLDATEHIPCDETHTQPGKRMITLTEADEVEVNEITDELMGNADYCSMDRDKVKRSVEAHVTVQKLLEHHQCNAFTMPCADVCATRRYNNEGFTMCLNHSLNNEKGICSACEYDVPALLSMVMLSALSDSAPYMGNTSYATPVKEGGELTNLLNAAEIKEMADDINKGNVFYTFHSVPSRKFKGFDAEMDKYEIQPFAAVQKFGATIRHDFNKDKGQIITTARLDPTCSKIVIARGTIVGGIGFKQVNCSEGVFFSVKDPKAYREGCEWTGIHCPLVYGDVFDEMVELAKLLGLEMYLSE